jgi:hypothetical protein
MSTKRQGGSATSWTAFSSSTTSFSIVRLPLAGELIITRITVRIALSSDRA